MGCPPPPYIKGEEEGSGQQEEACPRGAILLQVGFAPLSYSNWEKGKEEVERRKEKGGRRPLPLSNSDWGKGATRHLLATLSLLH